MGALDRSVVGGLVAAESKFHRERDASKVALVGLVDLMRAGGATLLDVQWTTPHLESLGAIDMPREEYLRRLEVAIALPQPDMFSRVPE